MALGKQAKVLSRAQIDGALGYIAKTREPIRNQVIFLLSVKGGTACKGDRVAEVGHAHGS